MNAGAAPTSRHRQDEGDEPVAPGGHAGRARGCRGDAALSVRFCCEPKTAVEIKAQKQKQPRQAKPVESRDREMRSGRGRRVCHADFPVTGFSPRGCGLSADAVPALRTDRRGDRGGGEQARPCEGGVLGWAAPQGRQAGHGPGPAGPLGRAAGPEHALYF